jgi:hypothetical protein
MSCEQNKAKDIISRKVAANLNKYLITAFFPLPKD